MTVEAIKEAIAGLPEKERHSLAVWINELDYDEWDRQMVKDFSADGRGAHLLAQVEADIAAGRFRPVEEICGERKQQRE